MPESSQKHAQMASLIISIIILIIVIILIVIVCCNYNNWNTNNSQQQQGQQVANPQALAAAAMYKKNQGNNINMGLNAIKNNPQKAALGAYAYNQKNNFVAPGPNNSCPAVLSQLITTKKYTCHQNIHENCVKSPGGIPGMPENENCIQTVTTSCSYKPVYTCVSCTPKAPIMLKIECPNKSNSIHGHFSGHSLDMACITKNSNLANLKPVIYNKCRSTFSDQQKINSGSTVNCPNISSNVIYTSSLKLPCFSLDMLENMTYQSLEKNGIAAAYGCNPINNTGNYTYIGYFYSQLIGPKQYC